MPVISISQPKYWSFKSIGGCHLPVGGGQPFPDRFHNRDGDAVSRLFVQLRVGVEGQHLFDALIPPALQPQAFPRRQSADAPAVPNAGCFPFVPVQAAALLCCETAGIRSEFRIFIQIHKAWNARLAAYGK